VFCSDHCYCEDRRVDWKSRNPDRLHIARPTVGAISELVVAADLLARGYEVFRALSPSCSCDLAILTDGTMIRVEVRTGSLLKNGGISFGWKESDRARHDVLAVVVNGSIEYRPSPDQWQGIVKARMAA
jgi:hypothetical protein